MPGQYRDMMIGEKRVVAAFMHYQIEQMNKENSGKEG